MGIVRTDLAAGDRVLLRLHGAPVAGTVHHEQPEDVSTVRVVLDIDPSDTWDIEVRNILEIGRREG